MRKEVIKIEEQEAFDMTLLKVLSAKTEVWNKIKESEFANYAIRFGYEKQRIFYVLFCIEKGNKVDIIKFLNSLEGEFTEYETEEEIWEEVKKKSEEFNPDWEDKDQFKYLISRYYKKCEDSMDYHVLCTRVEKNLDSMYFTSEKKIATDYCERLREANKRKRKLNK